MSPVALYTCADVTIRLSKSTRHGFSLIRVFADSVGILPHDPVNVLGCLRADFPEVLDFAVVMKVLRHGEA